MQAAQLAVPVAPVPVIWTVLGYQFEAGSMIVALIACFAVRVFAAQSTDKHRWTLDIPVSAIAMLFTAIAVVRFRPDPFFAGVYGTGIGAMGATIITASLAWVKRTTDVFSPPAGPDPAHAEPIAKLWAGMPPPASPEQVEQLRKLDDAP